MTNEEAIAWFEKAVPKNCLECPKEYDYSCSYANSLRCEAYMLARIALREQMERKHGEWIETENDEIVCSVCGIRIPEMYSNADSILKSECRFCHSCGADMRGKSICI